MLNLWEIMRPRLGALYSYVKSKELVTRHDLGLIVALTVTCTVCAVLVSKSRTDIMIILSLIFITIPLPVSMWYVRRPTYWRSRISEFAALLLVTFAFYVLALIFLCSITLIYDRSPSNVSAYLSVPHQLWNILPNMFMQAVFVSIVVPIVWFAAFPTTAGKQHMEILRRLSRPGQK
jgi:hypothetical protein